MKKYRIWTRNHNCNPLVCFNAHPSLSRAIAEYMLDVEENTCEPFDPKGLHGLMSGVAQDGTRVWAIADADMFYGSNVEFLSLFSAPDWWDEEWDAEVETV